MTIDKMTGLGNRRMLEDSISRLAKNRSETPRFLIFADVDNMKHFNMHNGHKKGDILLVSTAKMLASLFTHSSVFRFGGDQFVAITTESDLDSVVKTTNWAYSKFRTDLVPDQPENCGQSDCIGPAAVDITFSITELKGDLDTKTILLHALDKMDSQKLEKRNGLGG